MFLFYWLKYNCSANILLMEWEVTGISNLFEKIEKNLLNMNNKSISFYRFLPIFGCLTFTATILFLNVALYTWETDPEAMGMS
jgi:hypothetical protein